MDFRTRCALAALFAGALGIAPATAQEAEITKNLQQHQPSKCVTSRGHDDRRRHAIHGAL